MDDDYIEIDLNKFKVINSLLPIKPKNTKTLTIVNPSLYNDFFTNYFDEIRSKPDVYDFISYVPLSIEIIEKYIKVSIVLNIVLKKKLKNTNINPNLDFMKQYKTFKYLFINTTPIKKIMLFGIITAHGYMQDVEQVPNFKFILNENVLCLIKGSKIKMIKELINKKVKLKGEIRFNKEDFNYYFMIDDIEFINHVQLTIYKNKIVKIVEEILINHQWDMKKTHIDEQLAHILDQWYHFSQLSYLPGIDQKCLIHLNKCMIPPVICINKSNSSMYDNLKVAVFFNLLHTFYENITNVDLINELKTNYKICKMIINFIKKEHLHISDPEYRFFFKSLQHRIITDFSNIFVHYLNDGLINGIEVVELCELMYSKINLYLKYSSNLKITVRLKTFLKDENIMMYLVKHVCYNYLTLKYAKDTVDKDKCLSKIEVVEQHNDELEVTIHVTL